MFSYFLRTRRTQRRNNDGDLSYPLLQHVWDGEATDQDNMYVDQPKFTLRSLMAATCNWVARNKLGVRDGDLGPVYKAQLEDGQVVAVRRLLKSHWESFQFHELEDKLLLAAKLKHDNIVQLLGVCLEQPEKLLIYEFLPNASLDTILFDTERRRRHLDWEKRCSIIHGIARGLLYLHEESGLRINLKGILRPSKVLLGDDMIPKILDAGIPPPNTEDQTVFLSHSIVRYAAPEWAATGSTSTKSDMFSFGVILLEMVAGRGMYYDWCNETTEGLSQNGLTYVWNKWKAGSIADIADATLGDRYSRNEMRNCVHIALLCLQGDPRRRLDASAVVQALEGRLTTSLPTPSIPHRVRSIA